MFKFMSKELISLPPTSTFHCYKHKIVFKKSISAHNFFLAAARVLKYLFLYASVQHKKSTNSEQAPLKIYHILHESFI